MAYKSREERLANSKRYYETNRETEKARIREREDRIRKWFVEYKSKLKCERCGESHPACLQFHHNNAEDKDFNISAAVAGGWSIARILSEISKCEVLCANCHFKEHFTEFVQRQDGGL